MSEGHVHFDQAVRNRDKLYHAVRATNDSDVDINTVLPDEFVGKFETSQDGLAVMLDCGSDLYTWADHVEIVPALSAFTFTEGNRPSYLPDGCEDLTHAESRPILTAGGETGVTWFPVKEVI